jgi:hypothetical protein
MDRRTFLRGAAIAVSTPMVALAPAPVSAEERYETALNEFKAAVFGKFPDITSLDVKTNSDDGKVCRLAVVGFNF